MISLHLPIIQILLPLIAAPVCIIIRHQAAVKILSTLVSWLCFITSLLLLSDVLNNGLIIYELGGWVAPLGIEYRIDIFNAFVLLIVSGIGAVVVPYSWMSIKKEIIRERTYLFYCMMLLCLAGSVMVECSWHQM